MERLTYLFKQYTSKTATYHERLEFQEILASGVHDDTLKELIKAYLNADLTPHQPLGITPEEMMLSRIMEKAAAKTKQISLKVKLWRKLSIAASIAIAIAAGGYFYQKESKKTKTDNLAVNKNIVVPGKVGATLTLSNGKKIILMGDLDGKLAKEPGVSISKTKEGKLIYKIEANGQSVNKINSVSTSAGQTYIVNLSDGTMVWLNASSSLTFNTQLGADGRRKVKLSGEGYFEVAKDKLHPFVVETQSQQVEVLGTHFNINSYPDEPVVKTTLLEGRVKVNLKSGQHHTLLPGQQSQYNLQGFTVKFVDVNSAIDWKNNEFTFDNETLESILRKVARWYDVEIVYEGKNRSKLFWGSVSRYENIKQVLQNLELTGEVKFRLEGRRIYVIN
ncbi:FecR family protein [Pedobacter sp. P26]|uniref:FecR family protein n=1 Tax=Pedobacter sp. P26 TaxID=3423956 RepID=UPI003D66E016